MTNRGSHYRQASHAEGVTAFGVTLDDARAVSAHPISVEVDDNITYSVGEHPSNDSEYLLVCSYEKAGEPPNFWKSWRFRRDWADTIGVERPVLLLQEFAQELGETIEIGNQRNRFIYRETIPIPDVGVAELRLEDVARCPYLDPKEPVTWTFEVKRTRNARGSQLDVRYAYCIADARYEQWLSGDRRANVRYDTVFISYGEPDAEFARKLRDELDRYGVSCWLYGLDAVDGRRSWEEITEEIHQRDRTIIICSMKALIREGSLKEIETIVDHDPNKIICVSLDNDWKQPGFQVTRAGRDLKPHLMERNWADFGSDRTFYERARRLRDALRKPDPA